MQKTIVLILSLIMVLSFTACSSGTPSETTAQFLEGVKTQDRELVTENYEGNFSEFSQEQLNQSLSAKGSEDMNRIIKEEYIPRILKFDYEVVSEKVRDSKATVKVKITAYDMKKASSKAVTMAYDKLSKMPDADERDMEALILNEYEEQFSKAEKSLTKTVNIKTEKKIDKWKVSRSLPKNKEFINILSGGIINE